MAEANLSPFGHQLRRWRRVRRMSQLDLAHAAGASPRHISFIETGRSRPGEALVVRLAETLDVPLRERNELLRAAGLPPMYAEASLDAELLAPYRTLVERMLEQHEPFPAFAINRWWELVRANRMAKLLFGEVAEGTDLLELTMGAGGIGQRIRNLPDVVAATTERLRRELEETPSDERLAALVERAEARARELPPPSGPVGPVVCPILDMGDGVELRTITAIAQFNAPRAVTLDELRVELIYPADAATEAVLRSLAAN